MSLKTYFIDMDGTLVKHNYHPREIPDIILPGVVEFLLKLRSNGCYCILTTSRSELECKSILLRFKFEHSFEFDRHIYGLPSNIRVLINDNKNGLIKALAIAVDRDSGLEGLEP
jgi:beta-phosphoglucomutase-like phosphatase (HAD superfamily)